MVPVLKNIQEETPLRRLDKYENVQQNEKREQYEVILTPVKC